ncbi:penicillin-binding protein 2 [Lutispora saccharofermentans]|uniref:Penicillin-binding protein 2 n=1 Tax=Lutispora saccharofermentans TaxID=3024236 RepID=A0ABT1NDN9_9FIRM|nr:penicillin-binding protein 2 [Lutispora saccharofermentans]MCQ1528471.1 penicillin-binding protein 2 [Lutispora saccharofermentans]
MLKKYFSNRLNIIKLFTMLIFLVMLFKLAELQIVKGDYYKKRSETVRTRNINITAPRGNIVDRYGKILAGNKQSYSVSILKAATPDETINDIALTVINILEQNGDKYKDEIPILMNPIRFTFQDEEEQWKEKYNIQGSASPLEAFKKLREDYNISQDTIDIEAYSILRDEYEVELPFKVDEYQYSFKKDENKWKKNNGFMESDTALDVFNQLAAKYKIDMTKYSEEEARKIMAVKYLLKQNKYPAYEPIEIAANINDETRAMIEENKIFLPGVQIMDKPLRKYPEGDFASHILGYLGKISSDLEELTQKGYTPQDMIGKSGIEYSMEEYLKGKDGSKQIEVDARGTLIDTIDEIEPVPGDTVVLTLGSRLQKVAEESLRKTIEESRSKKPYPQTFSGAVVAMDVNTGEILAMASEPKFDPNLFASGISNKDWKSLQPLTDDRYAPKPLINNAISYPLPPGSTFKMLTATAGLTENKINTKESIVCRGRYTVIPGISPSDSHGTVHGATNVISAIKQSCNYFFFETGRRLGGELFEKYAEKYGFGQYTGIELPFESKGMIEGPAHKQSIYEGYIESYLTYTVKLQDAEAKKKIKAMIYEKPSEGQTSYQFYRDMKKRIRELGVTEDKAIDKIIWYITESKYRPGDVLNAAIGQGLNNVTPIQLAAYVATVANGGTRYKPYIVSKIIAHDGSIKMEKKPEVVETLDVSPSDMEAIRKGMFAVTNEYGGTARSTFAGSKVTIAGKTGTAEAGKYRPDPKNNPKLYAQYNDHSWFVGFAPYDKPEIAVVAVVFQGGFGSGSAPIARAIIEEYLASEDAEDHIVPYNELQP